MAQAPPTYAANGWAGNAGYPVNAYAYPQADYSQYPYQGYSYPYQYDYSQQYGQADQYTQQSSGTAIENATAQPPLPSTDAPPLPPGNAPGATTAAPPPPPPENGPQPPQDAAAPAASPSANAPLPPAAPTEGSTEPTSTTHADPSAASASATVYQQPYYTYTDPQQAWAAYYQQQQQHAAQQYPYANAAYSNPAYPTYPTTPQAPPASAAPPPWAAASHQPLSQYPSNYPYQPANQQPTSYQAPAPSASEPAPIRPKAPITGYNKAIPVKKHTFSAAPAYTKVQASNPPPNRPPVSTPPTSTPPTSSTSAQNTTPANTSTNWPPSLKNYVMRAFSSAKSDPDRQAMDQKLRDLIQSATKASTIWTTDWDIFPLPNIRASAQPPSQPAARPSNPSQPRASTTRYGLSQQQSRPSQSYDRSYDREYERDRDYGRRDSGSRKRSYSPSSSSSGSDDTHVLPQHQNQYQYPTEDAKRQRRVGRFGAITEPKPAPQHQHQHPHNKKGKNKWSRKARLAVAAAPAPASYDYDDEEAAKNLAPVVGTCQRLEKSYFRLTGQVDPATVRPPVVLERALARLVGMLTRGEATYFYACDQFKGMRQDLTVQHIRSELTVRVYEAHGRAALEYGEVADFNQCQTQLYMLYTDGLPGSTDEFLAYRVLYQTVHAARGEQRSLLATLQKLPQDLSSYPMLKHALKVRRAMFSGDVGAFFQLYAAAPGLSRSLMDTQVELVRHSGLVLMCKSMRPCVPAATLAQLLGFAPRQGALAAVEAGGEPSPGCKAVHFAGKAAPAASAEEAEEACKEWMISHGAVINETGALTTGVEAAKQLFIPEDTTKVAHGDANLRIEDFFAKLS